MLCLFLLTGKREVVHVYVCCSLKMLRVSTGVCCSECNIMYVTFSTVSIVMTEVRDRKSLQCECTIGSSGINTL